MAAHYRALLQQPVTVDEIEAQFALLAGGLKMQKNADSRNTAAAYLIAMAGFSAWAVRCATHDILKGEAEGFSKTFMPASAELAAYCATLERRTTATIALMERLLAAEEETKP